MSLKRRAQDVRDSASEHLRATANTDAREHARRRAPLHQVFADSIDVGDTLDKPQTAAMEKVWDPRRLPDLGLVARNASLLAPLCEQDEKTEEKIKDSLSKNFVFACVSLAGHASARDHVLAPALSRS